MRTTGIDVARTRRSVVRRALWALAVCLVASALWVGTAQASPKIEWVQGFPQRIGNQTVLMWSPVPGAQSYQLSRTNLATREVVQWEARENHAVDMKTLLGESYSYRVMAFSADKRPLAVSDPGMLEQYRPLPAPTWGGSYQADAKLFLVWQGDNASVYYNLYGGPEKEAPRLISSPVSPRFVIERLKPGETYVYTVRAVDKAGKESPPSDQLVVSIEALGGKTAGAEAKRFFYDTNAFYLQDGLKLREPTDVKVVEGNLVVTDMGSRSILVLSPDGKLLLRFATKPDQYPQEWGIPWGLGYDPQTRRYAVTFLRSPNLRLFNARGDMVLDVPIGKPKDLEEYPLLPQPMDAAFDVAGNLWVTDYAYGQVVRLNSRGKEVGRVGTPKVLEKSGPFKSPTFVDVHPKTNEVFVVDSLQGKLFRIKPNGTIAGSWGRPVGEEGALTLPKGLAFTSDGKLWVVDGMLSSLQRFDADGKLDSLIFTKDFKTDEDPDARRKRDALDVEGIVAAAVDEASGDVYVTTKMRPTLYLLENPVQK